MSYSNASSNVFGFYGFISCLCKAYGQLGAGSTVQSKSAQSATATTTNTASNAFNGQDLNIECRKGVNVEKPECVQWFNNLSNQQTTPQNGNGTVAIAYNPNKPYDTKLNDNYMIQVQDVPKISGCMTLATGKLIAIDQQGNYMPQVDQADCRKYMDGFRPFDYTKQQNIRQTQNFNTKTEYDATNNVAT